VVVQVQKLSSNYILFSMYRNHCACVAWLIIAKSDRYLGRYHCT
jgi:hypothetical protein